VLLSKSSTAAGRAGRQAFAYQLPCDWNNLLVAVANRVHILQPDHNVVWHAVSESIVGSMGKVTLFTILLALTMYVWLRLS